MTSIPRHGGISEALLLGCVMPDTHASVSPAKAATWTTVRSGRVRVAAVGDLHMTIDQAGRFGPSFRGVHERADVLLLAGDLTQNGTPAEAQCVASEVTGLGLPVIAVLGNHDHLSGAGATVAAILQNAGVHVLDETGTVLMCGGTRLGVAGIMGFGGGFAVVPGRRSDERAERFADALARLDCDVRVAMTHYAPATGTLAGEPARLYSVLGSSSLGEAIDAARPDLAIHGHAHHGCEHGTTPAGVPVRNVAYPVIRQGLRVYEVGGSSLAGTRQIQTVTGGRPVQ